MAITAADIIGLMKEVGIEEELIKALKYDVPLLTQGIDSIDLPTVAAAAEKKYGVDLSDADISVLKTVNGLVAFLNAKQK